MKSNEYGRKNSIYYKIVYYISLHYSDYLVRKAGVTLKSHFGFFCVCVFCFYCNLAIVCNTFLVGDNLKMHYM